MTWGELWWPGDLIMSGQSVGRGWNPKLYFVSQPQPGYQKQLTWNQPFILLHSFDPLPGNVAFCCSNFLPLVSCSLQLLFLPLLHHWTTTSTTELPHSPLNYHISTTELPHPPLNYHISTTELQHPPLNYHISTTKLPHPPLNYHISTTELPHLHHWTTTSPPLNYHIHHWTTTSPPLNYHIHHWTTTSPPLSYYISTAKLHHLSPPLSYHISAYL